MWRSARSNVPGDDEIALSAMDDCIKELRDLMNRNESQPNVDKPLFLLIGAKQQLRILTLVASSLATQS